MADVKYFLLAPLVNYFPDDDGKALIGGYLYSYKANDHSTKKNIAKIEEPQISADFYENPIELDGSGSVPDPYVLHFADDELYYLVLTNSNQNPLLPPDAPNIVRTWDNFGVQENKKPAVEEVDYTNYILNSQYRFWKEQSYSADDLTAVNQNIYIAENGWFFNRNVNNSDVLISFETFAPGQTDVPNNPIYYLNFQCTSVGTSETKKDILFLMNDVRSFANSKIQVAFYGISPSANAAELVLTQHFGVSSDVESIKSVQFTTTWSQLIFEIDIPDISGKTIDEDDNYLSIALRTPLNATSNLSITNWQLNRGDTLLEYNYKTKEIEGESKKTYQLPSPTDQDIFSILKWNSSSNSYVLDNETGKVRLDTCGNVPDGYLVMNGQTIVRTDKISTYTITYDRLYQKWENDSILGNGNSFGYGDDGFYPVVYNNRISFHNIFQGSLTDWVDVNTGFTYETIRNGTSSVDASFEWSIKEEDTPIAYRVKITNDSNGVVTDIGAGTTSFTVGVVQQGTVSLPEISYFEVGFTAVADLASKYFIFSTTTTDYYVWFTVDGTGTDPAVASRTGIKIAILGNQTKSSCAASILRSLSGFQQTLITTNATALIGGEYSNFENNSTGFYNWVTVDGTGTDPDPGTRTSIKTELLSTDDANQRATKIAKSISSYYYKVPDLRGYFIRIWDNGAGNDPSSGLRYLNDYNETLGDTLGTYQNDEVKPHVHKLGAYALIASGSDSDVLGDYPDSQPTSENTGNETRPINIYLNAFVKF